MKVRLAVGVGVPLYERTIRARRQSVKAGQGYERTKRSIELLSKGDQSGNEIGGDKALQFSNLLFLLIYLNKVG